MILRMGQDQMCKHCQGTRTTRCRLKHSKGDCIVCDNTRIRVCPYCIKISKAKRADSAEKLKTRVQEIQEAYDIRCAQNREQYEKHLDEAYHQYFKQVPHVTDFIEGA